MNQPKREWLKERHRFSEWAGRSELPKERRVDRPALAESDLPGWALERAERREAGAAPARHTSFWRRGGSDEVVRIDLFACASVDAAHEYLVDALGEFESNTIRRRTDAGAGDVAFGTETVALFARGNVVAVVRSAGLRVVSVTAVARAVDAIIVGRMREGGSPPADGAPGTS